MLIDVNDLIPSEENFYQVDDSLKQSIELVGILQPLLVNRPENGKYKVIAGHRRRLAVLSLVKEGKEKHRYVPCVYKKEEGVMDKLALIMANRFRDKSDWEKMNFVLLGIGNCPLCGVNLRWEGEGREIWEERESEIQKETVLWKNLERWI